MSFDRWHRLWCGGLQAVTLPARRDLLLPEADLSQRWLRSFTWVFLGLAACWLLLDPACVAFAQNTEGVPKKTLFSYIQDGGGIGLVILLCSIVGVSLAITFAFQIRRDILIPPEVLEQVEGLFEDEEYEEAFHVCEANPSFMSMVLVSGLSKLEEGYEKMRLSMDETGEIETTKLHQKVGYLGVIASVTPMLGLFGTVWGMIQTFNTIAIAEVQPRPADLAGGISTALVTTFLGLLVAIPMTVLFVVFKNRVVNVVLEVGGIAEELMGRFKEA